MMSTLEIVHSDTPPPIAPLQEYETHAEFLAKASDLLLRTYKLVAAEQDLEATLASISQLVLPRPGVWTVLEIHESVVSRRIGAPDDVARARAGSVLTVALSAGAETLGSLTFRAPVGGYVFDLRDRQLARDVAVGVSLAIVNARRAARREQSREMARHAAADRRSFIASLSHGFRTPLHAIHGYAQLLAEDVRGPLTDGQRHDVQRIQANERHLLTLVNSVIGFARWDEGEPLALEDISVRSALRLTDTLAVRAAARKAVSYSPNGDTIDGTLCVRAEPRRLREILLQLLLNAVQFSRAGDSVFVGAFEVGDKVWIRVTDTGIGIAEEGLASIFEPFLHGKVSNGGAETGVGLGLAVARTLARAMGGDLTATSERGRGSTFTLSLPCGRVRSLRDEETLGPNPAARPAASI